MSIRIAFSLALIYALGLVHGYHFQLIKEIANSIKDDVEHFKNRSKTTSGNKSKPVKSMIVEDMTAAERVDKETRELIESLNK